jgi:hypothetical protein
LGTIPDKPLQENLSLSDWVTFLSGEKHGTIGHVLNFSSFFVALMAILFSLNNPIWWFAVITGVVAIVLLQYADQKVFKPFRAHGRIADSLLKRIMNGELKSESSIRSEWVSLTRAEKLPQTTREATLVRKWWIFIILGILILGVVLAVLAQYFKDTNKIAQWATSFFSDWSNALTAGSTLVLAIVALFVIFETRYFRYVDDKTKTIASLNTWAAETFKHLAMLSHYANDENDFKNNFSVCRANLMVKVAESITIFKESRRLIKTIANRQLESDINYLIEEVDTSLRAHIGSLWNFDFNQSDLHLLKQQINSLADEAGRLTSKLRELMEQSGNI